MKITYNNNNAKKFYQEVNSTIIGFKPWMLMIREKEGNIVNNKGNALQRWSENLRSISNCRWNIQWEWRRVDSVCVQTAESYVEPPNDVDI